MYENYTIGDNTFPEMTTERLEIQPYDNNIVDYGTYNSGSVNDLFEVDNNNLSFTLEWNGGAIYELNVEFYFNQCSLQYLFFNGHVDSISPTFRLYDIDDNLLLEKYTNSIIYTEINLNGTYDYLRIESDEGSDYDFEIDSFYLSNLPLERTETDKYEFNYDNNGDFCTYQSFAK